MTLSKFRLALQPRESVKLLVPTGLAIFLFVVIILAVAFERQPLPTNGIALPLLACAAALAIIATIRSAGIPVTKVFPSWRTALLGALAIAILLMIGGLMASPLGRYEEGRSHGRTVGEIVLVPPQRAADGMPGRAVLWQAERIDAIVHIWALNEKRETATWLGRLYRTLPYVAESRARDRQGIFSLAQRRLRLLAPGAEAWQATEGLCREFKALWPNYPFLLPDFNRGYEEMAQTYSYVLMRNVTKQELMPLVPGGTCKT